MKKTNKTGWVIRDITNGRYINKDARYSTTKELHNAAIFPTRSIARELRDLNETVLHVAVQGTTPKAIIGGNGPNCRTY